MEITKESYIVTKEQMESVNTYVPVRIKSNWVSLVSERCIDQVNINAPINGEMRDMPPMYKENSELKSRYLMGAFVKFYLRGTFEPCKDNDDALMSDTEYDKWAGGHIFAQIERFKSDKDLRDTCFNMLNDFKDLERRLNVECHALLNAMNDSVSRELIVTQASVTPDAFQELMDSVENMKKLASAEITEVASNEE